MTSEDAFVAFGPGKQRIRPSDWVYRLMGLASAHWEGKKEPQPCGTCSACPETTCFVFPARLHASHPGLVRDLLFCLRMLEVPEVNAKCPRNCGRSNVDQKSAA
jgi:hypothetical protein